MITKEQVDGLNFDYITEHKKELENYQGYLPMLLLENISIIDYYNNLGDKLSLQVNRQYSKQRKKGIDEQVDDLIKVSLKLVMVGT